MDSLIAWLMSFGPQEWSAILVIVTGLVALSKKCRSGLKTLYKIVFPTRAYIKKHVEEEEQLLNSILKELKPNDSSSLRDAIDRIEHKQEDIEAFLNAQLNVHSVAVVRTDIMGRLIYANRAYQRILGVSAAEVMGDGWINVIHPEDRNKVMDLWHQTVKSQREFNEDIRFLTSGGVVLRGHANVYKETNRRGEVRGYIGVISFYDANCKQRRESCFEQMIELEQEGYENSKKR